MAVRSSISQAVQIGVETTPGTAVAAPRRLGSIGIQLGVQANITTRRPIGQKYANLAVLGKEWSEGEITGGPAYTELPYVFASVLSTPTVQAVNADASTPGDGGGDPSGAHRWVFETSNFNADVPSTFTVEQGDSSRAHRAANGIITELGLNWNRDEIELEGTLLARAIEDGVTLTPNAVMLPQVPVRPTELSVYLDAESGDLGTTKRTGVVSGSNAIGSRFVPVWVVDSALDSFKTTIEGEPEVTFTLMEEASAEGMDNLVRMRAGGTAFVRLHAVGPVINVNAVGDPIRHEMILDVAGQITEPNPFSDEDGVYAVEWGFGAIFSPDWGHAIRAEVVTTTAAL